MSDDVQRNAEANFREYSRVSAGPSDPGTVPDPTISHLICGTARSGSTFLCELLQSSNLAGDPGEFFSGTLEGASVGDWTSPDKFPAYLSTVIREGTGKNGVFGAKIAGFQHLETLLLTLRHYHRSAGVPARRLLDMTFPDLHYIWLTRRDKLRQAISHSRVRQTGQWFSGAQSMKALDELNFDPDELDRTMAIMARDDARWQEFFDSQEIRPFRVVYEELVGSQEETATEILRFLGVATKEAVKFEPRIMEKQSDSLTEEWVKRYRELKRHDQSAWTPFTIA